jgi:hypothetical protein
MPRWSDRQATFGAALVERGGAVPAGLVGPDGKPSARRFAVYRNNVILGLANGLAEAYPVVRRLVGADFFRAMAAEFAASHPPAGPLMFDYGTGFAEFLEGFEPVAGLPYLADVARLERAWLEAYHAAEEPPIGPEALQALGPEVLEAVRLKLHGTVRIVVSDFPVVAIWQANVGEAEPGTIDLGSGGETALIARPGPDVELRRLPAGAAEFLLALAAGHGLGAAAELALRADPGFDIAAGLGELFRLGLVAGFEPGAATRG